MYQSETRLRVRYAETDQMGFVYYGNYATYFEVARVEALRQIGISYKSLEDEGILLPVLDFNIKYLKPALYDDELVIRTVIPELPQARIRFNYSTFNASGELLNEATTTLVFINKESGKPCAAPGDLLDRMGQHFSSSI